MFYAHIVLAKKGPLARIWLAAHWDKKLTKAHVFETNIEQSVDGIMQPKVKLALRTSGHLLLGVVRIYSRKAKYLLADCNEAFVKIKMAFRPGMVDLPEEHREAAVNAITLPEVFHDFDTVLPELNDVDIEAQFSINQSRADEITMREDYGALPMSIHDDGFGDMGFDTETPDLAREGIDPNIDESLFAEELGANELDHGKGPMPGTSRSMLDVIDPHHPHLTSDDGFGDEFGQPAAGLFEGDIFGDAPLPTPALPPGAMTTRTDSDDDMDHFDGGAPSPASSSAASRPQSPLEPTPHIGLDIIGGDVQRPKSTLPLMSPSAANLGDAGVSENLADADVGHEQLRDQATLLNNEEESFALAPIDASALKGVTKAKRKRKLIVDEVKNISGEEMKSQLANTSDIVTTLDLAPPTKRLMFWKETGGVEKLFALPGRDIPARSLSKNYQRHLTSRAFDIEDFSVLGPADVLALEQNRVDGGRESPAVRRGRKRKALAEVQPEAVPVELTLNDSEVPRFGEMSQPIGMSMELRGAESMGPDQQMSLGADALMPPPATPSFHQMSSPQHASMLSLPMTPNIPMTPGGLGHGEMTPGDLHHGGMTPVHLGGLTPACLDHGAMTPHHAIEQMESIPNLPADQVSSILGSTGLEGYANMGYDGPHATPRGGMSERVANDWNEDYDFPASVGHTGEEQLENETDEQFEERVLNKRAAQMFLSVRTRLQKKETMFLSEMTFRNTKKQAAQKFYSLLVLKKFQALEIKQSEPYADILVSRGVMFDNPKL